MDFQEYELGPHETSDTKVFSLKGTSQLLAKLTSGEATIEFISAKEAKIVCGAEEFIMGFSDGISVDTYMDHHSDHSSDIVPQLTYTGSCIARCKVISSEIEVAGIARKGTAEVTKKRSITQLNVKSLPPTAPVAKKPHVEVPIPAPVAVLKAPAAQSSKKTHDKSKTLSWVILKDVSMHTTAVDLAKFFSGLAIQQVRVGARSSAQLSATRRVHMYVEFKTVSGCELAVDRSGELMQYLVRTEASHTDSNAPSSSGSSGNIISGGGNSNSDRKPAPVKEKVFVERVDSEPLVAWIQAAGVLLEAKISARDRLTELFSALPSNCVTCLEKDPSQLYQTWLSISQPSGLFSSVEPKTTMKGGVPNILANHTYLSHSVHAQELIQRMFSSDISDIGTGNNDSIAAKTQLESGLCESWMTAKTPLFSYQIEFRRNLLEANSTLDRLKSGLGLLLLDVYDSGVDDEQTEQQRALRQYCVKHIVRLEKMFTVLRAELWRKSHCFVDYAES